MLLILIQKFRERTEMHDNGVGHFISRLTITRLIRVRCGVFVVVAPDYTTWAGSRVHVELAPFESQWEAPLGLFRVTG